jgi:glycine cleavage system aminomethyltransferase T
VIQVGGVPEADDALGNWNKLKENGGQEHLAAFGQEAPGTARAEGASEKGNHCD